MRKQADFLIITNNPLVAEALKNDYTVRFEKTMGYRDILVLVRDMVYLGHALYTHPLAGSVKPNETPYKSIVISSEPKEADMDMMTMIGGSLQVFDKFKPKNRVLTPKLLEDFQLIDYTLLCGALDIDAAGRLSR